MPCDWVLHDRSLLIGDDVVRVHRDLPAAATAPADARALLASTLADHRGAIPAHLIWIGQLVTSELVTNAVLHARTLVHLGIAHDDRNLLIAVADGDLAPPTTRLHTVDPASEEQGRGMTIVAALADDFGWRLRTDVAGKIMWAVVSLAQRGPPRLPSHQT